MSTSDKRWNPSINFLRGIAILFIILHHNPGFIALTPDVLHESWAGVELFFVISGFIVTGAYLSMKDAVAVQTLRFWARRALRILPATLVFIFLFSLEKIHFGANPDDTYVTGLHTFMQVLELRFNSDLIHNKISDLSFTPLWSLVIEEQFYLVLPLLFAFIPVKKGRAVFLSLAALVSWVLIAFSNHRDELGRFASLTKLDLLAAGTLFCLYQEKLPHLTRNISDTLLMIGALSLLFIVPFFWKAWGGPLMFYMIHALAIGITGIAVGNPGFFASKFLKPISDLGRKSFSLYLVHIPVYYWIGAKYTDRYPNQLPYLFITLGLVLVWIVGTAFYYVIEKNITRLYRHV